MPHIIVEHSSDIRNIRELVQVFHDALALQDTIVKSDIKSRAIQVSDVIVGEESDVNASMVHVTIKLLPGRDDELKQKMAQAVHHAAHGKVASHTSITVETQELHKPSYTK